MYLFCIYVHALVVISLGSECPKDCSEESRGDCLEGVSMDYCEDDYFVSSEGESSDSWESECEVPNADDSLYVPTPERPGMVHGKPSPIDLPNKLCLFSLPQLGNFLNAVNEIRSCNTPGCMGDLAPLSVKSKGLGGGVSVSVCCTGCGIKVPCLKQM